MKDNTPLKKFSTLYRKLKPRYKPEEPPERDPVTQLVVSFLQWESTRRSAERAFTSLMAEMVDINELRVSHEHEVIAVLGENYPLVEERAARMREALNEVYLREHAVTMQSIAARGKKDQRSYLETLPGMPAYVTASVMLLSYGGHAMPVDSKLVTLLADEAVVPPDADPPSVEAMLLRQVKAGDGFDAHLVLQAWSDASRRTSPKKLQAAEEAENVAAAPVAAATAPTTKPTRRSSSRSAARRAKKK